MLASRQTALSLLQGSRALCGIPQRGLAARGIAPCAPAAVSVLAGCCLPAAPASYLPVTVDPCQHGWGTRPRVGQPVPASLSALLRYSSLCRPPFGWQGGTTACPYTPVHGWAVRPGAVRTLAVLSLHFSFLSFTPAGCKSQRCWRSQAELALYPSTGILFPKQSVQCRSLQHPCSQEKNMESFRGRAEGETTGGWEYSPPFFFKMRKKPIWESNRKEW